MTRNDTTPHRRTLRGRIEKNMERMAEATRLLRSAQASAERLHANDKAPLACQVRTAMREAYVQAMDAHAAYKEEATGMADAMEAIRAAFRAANRISEHHEAMASDWDTQESLDALRKDGPAALAMLQDARARSNDVIAEWGPIATEWGPFANLVGWLDTLDRWADHGHYSPMADEA